MREGFHLSLGIQHFTFDRTMDTLVASGNDPEVHTRAHDLLRSYRRTHRFAVVVLDNAWDGSPGVETIQNTIQANMIGSGWHRVRFEVVVIDSELEAWIWQLSQAPQCIAALVSSVGIRKVPLLQPTIVHNDSIYNGPQFVRNYINGPIHGAIFLTNSSMLLSNLSTIVLL